MGVYFKFDNPPTLICLGGCTKELPLRGVYVNFIKLNVRRLQWLIFHFDTPLGCLGDVLSEYPLKGCL